MKLLRNKPCSSSSAIQLAVLHVGLPPPHRLDMPGIDQHHLAHALEQIEHRLPIDPGRLHRRMGAAVRHQPVPQRQQLGGRGAEGARLLVASHPLTRDPQACDYRVFVHVQPAAPLVHLFHDRLHRARFGRRLACESLASVLPAPARATRRGARQRPGHVNHGLEAPMSAVDLRPTAHGRQATRFHATWRPEGA